MAGAGAVLSVGLVAGCFGLCRRTRNPVYSAILTSIVSNMGVHAWLVAGSLAAYRVDSEIYRVTILAGLGASALYAILLAFQLRGAAWVFPAARLLALVQATALTFHVAYQFGWAGESSKWFTTHPLAFLHLLYVSTGIAGAAIAAAFLVASIVYAGKAAQTR